MLVFSFSYPLDVRRRFRCAKTNVCLDENQLCDGVHDCPTGIDDDEEALCPWLRNISITTTNNVKRQFLCPNTMPLDIYNRCNRQTNCVLREDERFCNLGDPSARQFFLSQVDVLVDVSVYPSSLSVRKVTHTEVSDEFTSTFTSLKLLEQLW